MFHNSVKKNQVYPLEVVENMMWKNVPLQYERKFSDRVTSYTKGTNSSEAKTNTQVFLISLVLSQLLLIFPFTSYTFFLSLYHMDRQYSCAPFSSQQLLLVTHITSEADNQIL